MANRQPLRSGRDARHVGGRDVLDRDGQLDAQQQCARRSAADVTAVCTGSSTLSGNVTRKALYLVASLSCMVRRRLRAHGVQVRDDSSSGRDTAVSCRAHASMRART